VTGVTEDKAQRNFTDPESHIMPAPGGKHFEQAYNAQAVVDSANQVIVAADVTDQPSDKGQASPMMQQDKENTDRLPREMSADAGYFSSDEVTKLASFGLDVYIPPDKTCHTRKMQAAPRGRIPNDLSIADRMRRKLKTKLGRKRYGLRKELPEPVFGQIKQVRGFRQFLLRGKQKVRGEWRFICTGHNLLKLFTARSARLVGQEFWNESSPAYK
jgi:Transposase DDE domain